MLDRYGSNDAHNAEAVSPREEISGQPSGLDLSRMLESLFRHWRLILASSVILLTLGLAYLVSAVPSYTAYTTILIDSRRDPNQLSSSIAELNFDTGAIDSQLEVIKSSKVTLGVVQALSLNSDPQFQREQNSGLGALARLLRNAFDFRRWFVQSEILEAEEAEFERRSAVETLQKKMKVKRVGRTYVIEISYTSNSPSLSMKIANALADSYFRDQLEARFEITKRASGWLQDRLAELKENSIKSDLAIQKFKAEKGIVDTQQVSGSGQQPLADQQLQEITTQISNAHAETAKAEAKLQQIEDIIKSGNISGAVIDSLNAPIIVGFREKSLTASKKATELAARVGSDHYQVKSLINESKNYDISVFTELKRIAEGYKSELEIARARERSLNETLAGLVSQKAVSNQTMVQLRELQRESDVFKQLYQTFLERYQNAIQRESLPTTEARVLSTATIPLKPSWPRTSIVLPAALALGLLIGMGLAIYADFKDRTFRTSSQVASELGIGLLGSLKVVAAYDEGSARPMPEGPRFFQIKSAVQRYAFEHPLSSFAEVLRAAKVEIDIATRNDASAPKIIGVVSVMPNEGKTTTAANLAGLMAFNGARVLLLDCDFRNPSLTRSLAPQASVGLLEVARGSASLGEALLLEPTSRMLFIPSIVPDDGKSFSELLVSPEMSSFLGTLNGRFDYVIMDLPPVGPVVDVRAAGHLFDAFVLVIEWGKTPRNVIRAALKGDPVLKRKIVGAIFNKTVTEREKDYSAVADYVYSDRGIDKYYSDARKI